LTLKNQYKVKVLQNTYIASKYIKDSCLNLQRSRGQPAWF